MLTNTKFLSFKILLVYVHDPSTAPLLLRDRKRILELTPMGQTICVAVQRVQNEIGSLTRAVLEYLDGDAIPLAARIFSVADVFDALCSKRPYKEAMGFDAAIAILNKDTGSHFDPGVMAAFSPIARQVFDRLAVCDENEVRKLLEEQIRSHFAT